MLRVISGHYPSGAGQIAVTPGLATTFKLSLGSAWTVNGHAERVIGTVENPTDLQDDFALVPPGQTRPTDLVLIAVQLDRPAPRCEDSGPPVCKES